jgi:signal-transduction protein with cAMP-binding, CBS, and nucleotidyltransferase domain
MIQQLQRRHMKAKTIGDVATAQRSFLTINHTEHVSAAARALRTACAQPLVVMRDGALAGLVTESDLFARGMNDDGLSLDSKLTVADVMTKIGLVVTESTTLAEAIVAMERQGPWLPVTRDGQVVALVTAVDLLRLVTSPQPGVLTRAAEETEVMLSAPVWQGLLNLLAEAGI